MGIRELRARHLENFKLFWEAFPRRIDQQRALDEFAELVESGEDPQELIERARAFARNTDPSKLEYVPSPRNWLRDRRWEDTDLFQDQYASTRDWLLGRYDAADAAAVAGKYGFVYNHPPIPEGVGDLLKWHEDQRRVWIAQVARHVLYGEEVPS